MSTLNQGFKLTRVDGTTHMGYRWPLPMPNERVLVEASDPTEHDSPCPQHEGDGLCVALSARGASSGGILMSHAIGLRLEWRDEDVLARDLDKLRVRAVTVTGVFDPLHLIRSGEHASFVASLSGADLDGADLVGASLRGADLSGAYLSGANLDGANLYGANLRGADLRSADLRGADLRSADLRSADLRSASLRGAYLRGANLRGAYGRDDWSDLIARGAIR